MGYGRPWPKYDVGYELTWDLVGAWPKLIVASSDEHHISFFYQKFAVLKPHQPMSILMGDSRGLQSKSSLQHNGLNVVAEFSTSQNRRIDDARCPDASCFGKHRCPESPTPLSSSRQVVESPGSYGSHLSSAETCAQWQNASYRRGAQWPLNPAETVS